MEGEKTTNPAAATVDLEVALTQNFSSLLYKGREAKHMN